MREFIFLSLYNQDDYYEWLDAIYIEYLAMKLLSIHTYVSLKIMHSKIIS